MNREAEEFRISSDIKEANNEVLRGRLEQAKHYLAYFVDNEENHEENLAQRHMMHEEARQFLASQQGEQCISDTGSCGVGGYCAECPSKHPEQAEGAQGEREALPYWEPCNPACDPELNGFRDRKCHCAQARAALAQPSQAPVAYTTTGMLEILKASEGQCNLGAKKQADARWNVPLFAGDAKKCITCSGIGSVCAQQSPELERPVDYGFCDGVCDD